MSVGFKRGVLSLNGEPQFLLSADYPYYRDDVANWRPRLRALKELGIPAVTFYVPWRHHEVDGALDFTGRTQPNRNVVHFLELVKEEGLLAIVKPGPFIHAETDYGGLPDHLADLELIRDSDGNPRPWHLNLPAPLGASFTEKTLAYFEACLSAVVKPFMYPEGPVYALQVLNEGMFSEGNRWLTAYDYSESSLAEYRRRFGPAAVAPRRWEAPGSLQDVLPYLQWGRYQGDYMAELYQRFGAPLAATGLPVLTNQNPAYEDPLGMDWWLTRINPERWPVAHYGFTNWIGVVSHNEDCFNRYLLLCKRQPGPNLEENWGFSKLYDSRYQYTVIPFFQTVLAIAAGATGFNVYTGVGTAHWDDHLDSKMERPYPDSAPIGADGTLDPKAETLRLLAAYLGRYGQEIVTAKRNAPVAWGIYPAYAAVAGWGGSDADWTRLGVKPPRCGARALENFQRTMGLQSRDYHLVNIEEAADLDPAAYPTLVLCGGFFMDRATQERLLRYTRAGGRLILLHDMPLLDDAMQPCTVLRDGGVALTLAENPFEHGAAPAFLDLLDSLGVHRTLETDSPETRAWVLTAPNGAEHYFVLSLAPEPGLRRAGPVTVHLPGRSAAILRVAGGVLTDALIKGVNDCDGSLAVPFAEAGGVRIGADRPCDLLSLEGRRVTIS
ncbi:MAG TPA: beta-galactosidase [Symbiobacteriaceae bacterium]|nr:beta-galactosidase [Symbiobacteriaceae bacterium]